MVPSSSSQVNGTETLISTAHRLIKNENNPDDAISIMINANISSHTLDRPHDTM